MIARGEVLSVLGMEMRVMALEDVLVTKLMALTEHSLRYEALLPIARALREQVDWDDVRHDRRRPRSPARSSSCSRASGSSPGRNRPPAAVRRA